MTNSNITLGLDLSTTTTGYAYTRNGHIIDAGFIDLKKSETINGKAVVASKFLIEDNPYKDDIFQVNIEEKLSGFRQGRTSQQTLIKLAGFHAVFCFILEQIYKLPVKTVHPLTARKQVLGKSYEKGVDPKEFVMIRLLQMIPDLQEWDKLNTHKNWDKRNYDMYDAIVQSLYI